MDSCWRDLTTSVSITAVQQERGPRKNKGRRRTRLHHVTSRRDDVVGGNLSPTHSATVPRSTAAERAGAAGVTRAQTSGYRSAFTPVRRTAADTDLVANSNNISSSGVTSQSAASAVDAFSRCKHRLIPQ